MSTTVDDLATVRAGDKGDTLILGVVARDGIEFDRLLTAITAEAVAKHYGLEVEKVSRVAVPGLSSLSFTLVGMLGAGVTGSAFLDGHGKTLSYHLLTMSVCD